MALGAVLLVVLATALITTGSQDGDGRESGGGAPQPAAPTVGAPADPLIGTPEPRSAPASEDAPSTARAAAKRFLRGYLALLYGRGDLDQVTDATPAVRRALRASIPRIPAAQRQRRPRVIDRRLTRQSAAAILVTASIDDGGAAVYPIVFTLDRRPDGRWLVSRLAND